MLRIGLLELRVDKMIELLERLHRDAKECRELADNSITVEGREALQCMAQEYESRAAILQTEGARARDFLWWR